MVNWPWSKKKEVPSGSWVGLEETLKVKPKQGYLYHIGERIYNWPTKCDEYDKYYNNHPEVKSQVLSIAGRATAKGLFLEPRSTGHPDEDKARWQDADDLCENLNVDVGMDQLLYETIIPLVKYGTVLWEKTWDPPGLQLIPIVKDYKPVAYDNFEVSQWEILENGQPRKPRVILDRDRVVEFSWNVTSTSWPYGTSLLAGLGQTLEITEQLLDDLEAYLHKAAFPGGLFQIGDNEDRPTSSELGTIQTKIKNWEPGENYVTSYVVDYKVIGPASAETRMLGESLQYLKDRLVDGVMVAPISRQYQRTLASAEEMEDDTMLSLIIPVQRLCKRVLERQVYRPYLEFMNHSVKNVPSVSFHPPDEDRVEQADYYLKLVHANIMTREAAARELGVDPEDIPSKEQLAMKVIPPNGFGQENPIKPKAEETIHVHVDYGEADDDEADRGHRHGA